MTQIDWSLVAQSEGYNHFKQQYIKSVQRDWRNKKECYKHFQLIIGLAKNHAAFNLGFNPCKNIHTTYYNTSTKTAFTELMIDVLDQWAEQCNYWYFNFRPQRRFNNLCSRVGIRGEINYIKTCKWYSPKEKRERTLRILLREQKANPKSKTRWKNDPYKKRKLKKSL